MIAVFIHTFLRDETMYRCVNSVLKHIPNSRIYLSDGGRKSSEKDEFYAKLREQGHFIEYTPTFNYNWRQSFNDKLDHLQGEEYLLKVDDDFYFTKSIKPLEDHIHNDPTIGLLGGQVFHHKLSKPSSYIFNIEKIGEQYKWDYVKQPKTGYVYCDVVPDFWIARTSIFDDIKMDGSIPPAGGGHEDFFTRIWELQPDWKVAYTNDFSVEHEKSKNTQEYNGYRNENFEEYFNNGWDKVIRPGKQYSASMLLQKRLKISGQKTPRKSPEGSFPDNTTAIIKTFERPACVKRLVKSIRKYYPTMKIIVLNDGKEDVKLKKDPNIQYIKTEFDIGLSDGRNRMVEMVTTLYTLLLDDDFVFYDKTKIENFEEVLETTDCDIVGGAVTKDGKNIGHFEGSYELVDHMLICNKEMKEIRQGVPRYDFVFNFFLAKTDVLKEHKWDKRLKVTEHTDYFLTHKDKIKVGYCKDVVVLHHSFHPKEYMKYRNRDVDYLKLFMDKWRLKVVETYQGFRIERENDDITTQSIDEDIHYITGSRGYIGTVLRQNIQNFVESDLKIGKDAVFYEPEEDIDYIFHLAAQASVPQSFDDMLNDARNNILTTIKQIQIANKKDAKLIYVSSAASIDPESPYGLSKKVGEDYIKLFCKKYAIIRLPNIFGDSPKGVISIFERSDKLKVSRGCTRTFTHVKDVVNAFILAKNWKNGEYRLGNGESISVEDIAKAFNKEYEVVEPREGEIIKSKMENTTPNWNPQINVLDYIKDRL